MVTEYGEPFNPKASGTKEAPKSGRGSIVKRNTKASRPKNIGMSKKGRTPSLPIGPKSHISTASLPPQSRKTSTSTLNFQHQPGTDEEDLSTKPRCQRCRKSKKGCDRQRPCQRCKDAGIGIEGCVSEDEGNGHSVLVDL